MKYFRLLRVVSIISVIALTGCVQGYSPDVPPAYQLTKAATAENPAEGVIAFSMKVNVKDLPCNSLTNFGRCRSSIGITDRRGYVIDWLKGSDSFQLDVTKEGLFYPATYIAGPLQPRKDMVILRLPAGQYALNGWAIEYGTGTVSPANYRERYDINVSAGKVTYLGRLDLVLDVKNRDNLRYVSGISNHSKTEIPKILEVFPQFKGAIRTSLFKRNLSGY